MKTIKPRSFVCLVDDVNYQYPSLVEMPKETHGGDDVMVFARGPWAHLFTGNFEQNEIPLAMAFAAGISTDPPAAGSGSIARLNSAGRIVMIAVSTLLLSLVARL